MGFEIVCSLCSSIEIGNYGILNRGLAGGSYQNQNLAVSGDDNPSLWMICGRRDPIGLKRG